MSGTTAAHPLLAVNPATVARRVGDAMVVLDLQSGIYYSLNEIGAVIWSAIMANKCVDQIREQILAGYNVPSETVAQDMNAYISELIELGLLRSQ